LRDLLPHTSLGIIAFDLDIDHTQEEIRHLEGILFDAGYDVQELVKQDLVRHLLIKPYVH